MVNSTCDFCSNTYRKNPSVGYFKVSSALKSSLRIREGADLNTICGKHFSDTDIAESGRLRPEAKPVFFPRLSTAAHDHPYVSSEDTQDDNAGMYYVVAKIYYSWFSPHFSPHLSILPGQNCQHDGQVKAKAWPGGFIFTQFFKIEAYLNLFKKWKKTSI